jgi:hypothetical protein
MKRKWLVSLLTVSVLAIGFNVFLVACGQDAPGAAPDRLVAQKTANMMRQAMQEVGLPAIKNWQELKLAKMIFELRDQSDLVTYAYLKDRNGELKYLGQCIGYGLPYSVQYTNPMRPESVKLYSGIHDSGRAAVTLPQPDPNGLFMPTGLSATWLMMIDPKTKKPGICYIEPEILVFPFPMHDLGGE